MKNHILKSITVFLLFLLFFSSFVNIYNSNFLKAELEDYNNDDNIIGVFSNYYDYNNFSSYKISSGFPSFFETEKILKNISITYPDITRLYSIGKSYEGRNIWCLEISSNPGVDEGKPGVLYMGLHHAREWPSLVICLYLSVRLVEEYGKNDTITDLINNRRIWVVPCVNPDGYYYDHDCGYDWRKNRQYYEEFESYGVDLNRNYAGSCNKDIYGAWGNVKGSMTSHKSNFETYCGDKPFSEYETQAIKQLLIENDISASISWHTFGELVLWPWGYSTSVQTPDYKYMSEIGTAMAQKIKKMSGTGHYLPQQSALLYPTTGDTTDWFYGYSHYVLGRPHFAYTIEACSSYHPDEIYLQQVCKENYNGAIYLLNESYNISKYVTPRVIITDLYSPPIDNDGNFSISWSYKNKNFEPEFFRLDELTDLNLNIDNADNEKDLWVFENFSKTKRRSYTGKYSYKSHREHDKSSAMTTKYPLFVEPGMKLSFWCNFNIQKNQDMAFVEVSRDKRNYDLLDSFTGLSRGWIYKEYSLRDYTDESIYIRFRYSTNEPLLSIKENIDGELKYKFPNLYRGFYVDNIFPVPEFQTINTVSDSIKNLSISISNRSKGDYYYRVSGYNSVHGWCDFSGLEKTIVGENTKPYVTQLELDRGVFAKFFNLPIIILKEYQIIVNSTNHNSVNISYYVDWGDGTNTGWTEYVNSEKQMTFSHIWMRRGIFDIRVKVKDENNLIGFSEPLRVRTRLLNFF